MKRLALLLAFALIITGCEKKESPKGETNRTTVAKPKQAPKPVQKDFILKNIDGKEVRLHIEDKSLESNASKKVTMLFFFTTWCPSCKAEAPELAKVLAKHKERVQIFGILLDRPDDIEKFLTLEGVEFFVSTSFDENNKLAKRIYAQLHINTRDMPIPLVVMYVDGKYFIHYLGAAPYEMIESDIKNALGE